MAKAKMGTHKPAQFTEILRVCVTPAQKKRLIAAAKRAHRSPADHYRFMLFPPKK